MANLIETVNSLTARKIQFRSLTDAIDTSTASVEFTFHISAAFAQMDVGSSLNAPWSASRRFGPRPLRRPTDGDDPGRLAEARRMRDAGQTLGLHRLDPRRRPSDGHPRVPAKLATSNRGGTAYATTSVASSK